MKHVIPAGQLWPAEQSRMHSEAPSPVTSWQMAGAVPPCDGAQSPTTLQASVHTPIVGIAPSLRHTPVRPQTQNRFAGLPVMSSHETTALPVTGAAGQSHASTQSVIEHTAPVGEARFPV